MNTTPKNDKLFIQQILNLIISPSSYKNGLQLGIMLILFITPNLWLSAQSTITFDQFMGANVLRQNNISRLSAVGFAREYHEWVLDEGYPGLNGIVENASPGYPNNQFRWNPSYQDQTYIEFDEFYQQMWDMGLILAPNLFQSAPYIVNPHIIPSSTDVLQILEQKPVFDGDNPELPASYIAHADYLYQYAARYGSVVFSPEKEAAFISPKLHPNESSTTGLSYVTYIESWNEPDKWWYASQYPTTYFSPKEYAAMLSADYDGHGQTLGLVDDPDNPGQNISTVGIKNADIKMKVVMAGLSDLDLNYLQEMVAWCDTARLHALNPYPFDVINFHHYSNDGAGLNQFGTTALSPEEVDLRTNLSALVAYRDQTFPDKEIWISEFGYDTDAISEQAVPVEGIGSADQQEIQAQWIVRSFLEIAAAGVDRAMVYTLQDACSSDTCGLYSASGLIMNEDRNYQPKKSWYYTYSLKNILKETIFDSDLSPCSSDDCAIDCPRVYKFSNPDNPNIRIYAVWSPTSCDKATYTYNLDLEGAVTAQMINLKTPSIYGESSTLTGATVDVPVSERPVFIVAGSTVRDTVEATNPLMAGNQTCSTVQLMWNNDLEADSCQIWLMNGHVDTLGEFNISQAQFIADDIPISNGEFNVAGLQPDSNYTFVTITSNTFGETSPPRYIYTQTLNINCKIEVLPEWIYDYSHANALELFDEQMTLDPTCGDTSKAQSFWGIQVFDDTVSVSLDLQQYYYLDAFYLFDGNSYGDFRVEYAVQSPNGTWMPLVEYQTIRFANWVSLSNFLPSDTPVRFLKFIGDFPNTTALGELFICGRPAMVDESTFPPGLVRDLMSPDSSCNSITLQWTAPFDDDIAFYNIHYGTNEVQQVPADSTILKATVFGLETATSYIFSVETVDLDGNVSGLTMIEQATLPLEECVDDCSQSCPCFICLKPSYIYDLTPADGIHPQNLVDEQASTNPICGSSEVPLTEWGENYSDDNVPPAIAVLDLQLCYRLNSIYLFDSDGTDTITIEYQDTMGNWVHLLDYETIKNNEWHEIENINVITRFLRFTKQTNQAKINEIAVCGFPFGCEVCSNDPNLEDDDNDGVSNDCDICMGFDDTADIDQDGIPDGCDIPCPGLPGEPCDDGVICTMNDVYDADCNCQGVVIDTDGDGVCNPLDVCPVFDDNLDNNSNGIPDSCEVDCSTFMVETIVDELNCFDDNDGKIELVLPFCDNRSNTIVPNIALDKTAIQSSEWADLPGPAHLAIDDNTNGEWFAQYSITSTEYESQPWWELDLEAIYEIDSIQVWGRTDCCQGFLVNYYVMLSEQAFASDDLNTLLNDPNVNYELQEGQGTIPRTFFPHQTGRFVRIQLSGTSRLQLAEVRVFGKRGVDCNFDFNWDDGSGSNPFGNVENLDQLSAGTYDVTITHTTSGCNTPLSIVLDNPTEITCPIEVIDTISTENGNEGILTIQPMGGTDTFTYLWNNQLTTDTIFNLPAGTYTVTVTDTLGCTCVASTTLFDPAGDPEPPTGYCSAIGQQPWHQYIEQVVFGDIDHISFKEQYADFTAHSTEVMEGHSYDLTLNAGYSFEHYEEHWSVYIDYNRDGDFEDANELAFAGLGTNVLNTSISIPTSTGRGATRMRVMMKNGEDYALPCETFTLGEVEDYLVILRANSNPLSLDDDTKEVDEVIDIPNDEVLLFPNPTKATIWLYHTEWEDKDLELFFYNELGQAVFNKKIKEVGQSPIEVDISTLPAGVFWVEMRLKNRKRWLQKLVVIPVSY